MTHTVVLSGGLDSTVALAWAIEEANLYDNGPVRALSFDYGQRHRRELEAATAITIHYGVPHTIVELDMPGSSALTDAAVDVPDGHYAEQTMKATVVPGRNLLFAANAIAHSELGGHVWVGVHAGDHPIYPDCRPEFWDALRHLTAEAYGVGVVTPFITASKADIARKGHDLGAPLGLTWSCYKGGTTHCGRCGTCVERAEAFHLAGVTDPTTYEDPTFWRDTVGA